MGGARRCFLSQLPSPYVVWHRNLFSSRELWLASKQTCACGVSCSLALSFTPHAVNSCSISCLFHRNLLCKCRQVPPTLSVIPHDNIYFFIFTFYFPVTQTFPFSHTNSAQRSSSGQFLLSLFFYFRLAYTNTDLYPHLRNAIIFVCPRHF